MTYVDARRGRGQDSRLTQCPWDDDTWNFIVGGYHLLVSVKDIDVSRVFFEPVLAVLEVPIDREGEDWFLADELMVVEEKRRFGRVRAGGPRQSRI